MATHTNLDNDPLIVESILSKVCWNEYDRAGREFEYEHVKRVVRLLKSGTTASGNRDYPTMTTLALETLKIPKSEWTTIRALASAYFKEVKDATIRHPLAEKHWDVTVDGKAREICLYHPSTMTRSESFFSHKGFELGSVTVEGRPCRSKSHIELHRNKGMAVTYRILSGR